MRRRLAALARDEALLARLARIAIWVAAVAPAISSSTSYDEAKVKSREMREKRRTRRAAKRPA